MFAKLIALLPLLIEIIKKIKIPFIKFAEPLHIFCDDVEYVYKFKEHCVIPKYDILYKSLTKYINKVRKKGEVLVLDLSAIKTYNEETREALRDAIRDMIIKNNIRCFIIFPVKKLNDLFDEVHDLIEERTCKSIYIKKDERKKRKIKKV